MMDASEILPVLAASEFFRDLEKSDHEKIADEMIEKAIILLKDMGKY